MKTQGEVAFTLAEQVFQTLSEAILGGEIPPGTKISEPLLARRYGVSRGPLREALHRLQERRLITRSANQGARVVQLSPQGLAELFVVREALEAVAAREASLRATLEEREALKRVLVRHQQELIGLDREGLEKAGFDAASLEESKFPSRESVTANRDFHFLIAQASRNPMLIQLLCDELYPLLRLYRGPAAEPRDRAWRAFEEHRRILSAVEDRDPELAELQMRRHVAAARCRRENAIAAVVANNQPGKARRVSKSK